MNGRAKESSEFIRIAQKRAALATNAYGAMVDSGKLANYVLLTYRCPRGCSVLHVVSTPQGVIFGWPRYKMPARATETRSTAAGRAANTEDGSRHWKRRASFADTTDRSVGVQCDHMRREVDVAEVQCELDREHYPRDVRLLP